MNLLLILNILIGKLEALNKANEQKSLIIIDVKKEASYIAKLSNGYHPWLVYAQTRCLFNALPVKTHPLYEQYLTEINDLLQQCQPKAKAPRKSNYSFLFENKYHKH